MKTKDERTGRDNNNYYCRTRFNLRTCISLRTLTPFEATRFSSLRTLTTQSFLRRTRLHAITINIPIKFVGGSGVILICIGSPVRRIYLYVIHRNVSYACATQKIFIPAVLRWKSDKAEKQMARNGKNVCRIPVVAYRSAPQNNFVHQRYGRCSL